jgi:hypothetical protein
MEYVGHRGKPYPTRRKRPLVVATVDERIGPLADAIRANR